MMPPSSTQRQRHIRQLLKSSRTWKSGLAIQRLARAVWNVPDHRFTHLSCSAKLPDYIDAEIEGTLNTWHPTFVREHLLACHRCATDYAELLRVAILDAQPVPDYTGLPLPDLTFVELPHDESQ